MTDRIVAFASRLLGIIAACGLFAMMALTFVDVIGRYGFHKSVFGAAEMIEYLMVFTIFAGLAFITARNEHITVTLLDPWIEKRAPVLRRWVVVVFSVATYALITWKLLEHGIGDLESGKRSAVLDLPLWTQGAAAGVLSLVGLVLLIAAVVRTRGRLGDAATAADGGSRGHGGPVSGD